MSEMKSVNCLARLGFIDGIRHRLNASKWHDVTQTEVAQLLDSYDLAVRAGNALRMAAGQAVLITTAEEVRMPREDWDRIVEAAIAQRREVDPTAVDDGE